MNILNVVNTFFTIPYFFGNQFEYLSRKGYKIHVICSHSEKLHSYSLKNNFHFKEVQIKRRISLLQDILSIIKISLYIKKNKINVVSGHTPKGALLSMTAAYLMRVPIRIYFRHGLVYETTSGIKRQILIYSDKFTSLLATKIICVSQSVANKSIIDKLNRASKQTLLFNGTCNGIDTIRFSRSRIKISNVEFLRKKYDLKNDDYVVGFSGRIVKDKGILELYNALKIIRQSYENIKLLLVGTLDERDNIDFSFIDEIRNDKNVIITGYIDYDQIENYYFLMNIFALPSYREGFPTSVLEASSMELPIITTRSTGCIDSIIENQTGIFISHDPIDISNKIKYFINNNDIGNQYGRAGRQFVKSKFKQKNIWEEIIKLYEY